MTHLSHSTVLQLLRGKTAGLFATLVSGISSSQGAAPLVGNTSDSGTGSLRAAFSEVASNANSSDNILFSSLFNSPQAIALASSMPSLTKNAGFALTMAPPATLTVNSGAFTFLNLSGSGVYNISNVISQGSNAGAITVNSGAILNVSNFGFDNLTLNGGTFRTSGSMNPAGKLFLQGGGANVLDVSNGTTRLDGAISGTGTLTKAGAGLLTLSGSNSYAGGTTITSGTLGVAGNWAISTGAITITGGGIRAEGEMRTLANSLLTSGTFTLGRSTNFTGTTTLLGNTTIIATNPDGPANANSILGGPIVGNYGLTITEGAGAGGMGTGAIVFSGSNSYTGGTTLGGGMLTLGSSDALGTSGQITFGGGTMQFTAANTTDYSSRFSTAAGQAYRFDTNGQNVTLANGLRGFNSSLAKLGSGTLSVTGSTGFPSSIAVEQGTLQLSGTLTQPYALGSLSVASSGTLALNFGAEVSISSPSSLAINGTLDMKQTGFTVIEASLSGTGRLLLSGSGATILARAGNTYAGGTIISSGTLAVSMQAGLGTGNVTNNGALVFLPGNFPSGAITNNISGTGTFALFSGVSAEMSGNNTYTGATQVDGNALLYSPTALGSNSAVTVNGTVQDILGVGFSLGSLSGTGGVIVLDNLPNARTYSIGSDNRSTTFSGFIGQSGSGTASPFIKTGTGTLILTGSNTYQLPTIVNGGTLQIGNGASGSIDNTASVTVGAGAAIAFNEANGKIFSRRIANGGTVVGLQGAGITNTLSGIISGTGGFTQSGAGTTVLSGSNTFTGGITINAGTVSTNASTALGLTPAVAFANVAGANLNLNGNSYTFSSLNGGGSAGGNISLGSATLTLTNTSTNLYGGIVSGTGGRFVQAGPGTTILSGSSTYTGGTTISAGTLQVGNGGATASLGSGNITNNSTLVYNRSSSGSETNSISGAGSVTQNGKGTLILSGSNSYSGATIVNGGTLTVGSARGLGNTSVLNMVDAVGSTLDLNGFNQSVGSLEGGGTIGGNIKLGSATLTAGSANTSTTYGAVISGAGGLTKVGTGTLHLTGTSSYTGATTIGAGTLVLHGTNTVLPTGASLVLEANKGVTVSGGKVTRWQDQSNFGNDAIAGAGAITTGTLANGATALIFNGSSSLNSTLASSSTTTILAVVQTAFSSTNQTILGSTMVGDVQFGLTNGSGLNVRRQGTNTSSYFAIAGNLTLGTPGILGVTMAPPALTFYNGSALLPSSGGTQLPFTSAGTVVVGGIGTGTQFLNGGLSALVIYNSALSNSAIREVEAYLQWKFMGGPVPYTDTLSSQTTLALTGSGAALDLNGGVQTVASLSGVAGSSIYLGSGTLTTGGDNTSTTFAGSLSDTGGLNAATGGTLVKKGSGTLTLTGSNGNAGAIALNAGTLQIGNGGTSGSLGATSIRNNAAVVFNRSDASTYAGILSGTGTVLKTGAGRLTLTANNTYSGNTVVSAGVLQLGDGGASGSVGGNIVNNASVVFARSDSSTYAGAISGTGSITKISSGTLTLSGSSSYSGGTTIQEGTLRASINNAMGTGTIAIDGGIFVVDAGVTLTNSISLRGGQYQRAFAAGASLVNAVNATSNFAGGRDTTASILAGTLTNAATLQTSFSATSDALNDEFRLSDVYHFEGTGSSVFVLELSMTSVEADSYLAWLDTSTNTWVNAVDGNTGTNNIQFINGAYDGNLVLGHYGVDTVNGTVWAVLNHNSAFAIVPEPGTCALLVLGGMALLVRRRR